MIIKLLLQLIFGLVQALTLPIAIPTMPDGVENFLTTSLEYIGMGISVVGCFVDLQYLITLFALVIMVDAGIFLYRIVMWFIKKIPMLGID